MQRIAGLSGHITPNIYNIILRDKFTILSLAFFMCLGFLLFNLELRLISMFLQLELAVLFKIHSFHWECITSEVRLCVPKQNL